MATEVEERGKRGEGLGGVTSVLVGTSCVWNFDEMLMH